MPDTQARPFFYGSSTNRLNAKGQVAIPKRFRDVVPEAEKQQGFVLVLGEWQCIYMYTHRQFGAIKDRVRAEAEAQNDPEFLRRFMEGAHPVELDTQGRFVLPTLLRETAAIQGPDALFVGMDDRIEVWSPALREARRGGDDGYASRRQAAARRIFGI